MGNETSQQQGNQQVPSSSTTTNVTNNNNQSRAQAAPSSSSTWNPSSNAEKRAYKKTTGRRLAANQIESMPSAKISNQVELDDDVDEAAFLSSVQSAYGNNAKVEINTSTLSDSNYYNNSDARANSRRKQISYQVTFNNNDEARQAYNSSARVAEQVIKDLGLKGSSVAFDKPCEPKSIDGITLQLDSDSSSILCGACLLYDYNNKLIKTIHYSDREYENGVIKHSGDTKVHGKSVHTIKLGLSDLDNNKVKQLFFTLCACGPADLSKFKEPLISLHENDNPDINLIQYPIEQAGKARSVVMCRIFRNNGNQTQTQTQTQTAGAATSIDDNKANDNPNNQDEGNNDNNNNINNGNNWSIQALGSEEWHIPEKVCMHYQYATQLIGAHLKETAKKTSTKTGGSNDK